MNGTTISSQTKPKAIKLKSNRLLVSSKVLIFTITQTDDIAYCFSEEKQTYIVTREGKKYIVDQTLDSLEEEFDPLYFFRISRSTIVRISAIGKIVKHFNRQLKMVLIPSVLESVVVSRSRVDELLRWLNR